MSPNPHRPRRAMLFMPADDLRKIQKGAGLSVDAIIMDLEDGVTFSQKEIARQTIPQALQEADFGGKERWVRINAVGSGLETADLAATYAAQPDGFVIPKAESAAQIHQVADWLTDHDSKAMLFAIIESPLGVVNLKEIVAASPRLVGLMFGAEDLMAGMGGVRTPPMHEAMYGRWAVVAHAKAFGLQAIDTPYVDIHNLEGLAEETKIARQMGYDGKLAIHPKHIAIIEAAFMPSEAEITRAQALLEAYERHQADAMGVFTFEGKMIDTPMIRAAQEVIKRAGVN